MNLTESKVKLKKPVLLVMTLWLILCCVGCISRSQYYPTVSTQTGNGTIATLPAGTQIRLYKDGSEISRAFVNETKLVSDDSKNCIVLETVVPLKLATPAYINERDERELIYIETIERLQQTNISK